MTRELKRGLRGQRRQPRLRDNQHNHSTEAYTVE